MQHAVAGGALAAWLRPLRADRAHCLLALDFDGTLAPIVPDPSAARPSASCRSLLARLSCSPRCTLVLLSGRGVPSLRALAGLPASTRMAWVGAHGATCEASAALALSSWGPPAGAAAALAAVRADLETVLASGVAHGAALEDHGSSLSCHYRACSERGGAALAAAVDAALVRAAGAGAGATDAPVLERRGGQLVHEVRLRGVDKGVALARIVRDAVAGLPASGTTALQLLVAGDDVTDEDAFGAALALEGELAGRLVALPIVIAGAGGVDEAAHPPRLQLARATAARAWLRDPAEVEQVLQSIAKMLGV